MRSFILDKSKGVAKVLAIAFLMMIICPLNSFADTEERLPEYVKTPNYKVAFYPYNCYHMKDEYGRCSGYGYEMMEDISKYIQCTFTYEGYDKSAEECVELLRKGELDVYTAAKKTPERESEFAFSTHPAITSYTCMNVRVDNQDIIPGDYSTYSGKKVGLLRRHTYNGDFIEFTKAKGISCDIYYYDTPTELNRALVNREVDAIVDSYIRISEDEKSVENFGETPYYIMVRKEDKALVNKIDAAIDRMNVDDPNWRTDLYNKYYGAVENSHKLSEAEIALKRKYADEDVVIKAVMDPDNEPYSWYEDGEAKGILADYFRDTAKRLNLKYEFIPVKTRTELNQAISDGKVDILIDINEIEESVHSIRYEQTDSYFETTLSLLRVRGSSEKIARVVAPADSIQIKEILAATMPNTELIVVNSIEECKKKIISKEADAALMMSYTAQKIASDSMMNRLQAEILPGATIKVQMGVKATLNYNFYGLWNKTLTSVSDNNGSGILQKYLNETVSPNLIEYLFNHPVVLVGMCLALIMVLALLLLYFQSERSKKKQEKISSELALALERAEEATQAKQDFFSKMSHDIRTPLNVVLGMTQIAQKYKDNPEKLDKALSNVKKEGNYLMVLINSILDVNQLEHGAMELVNEPFEPEACLRESVEMVRTLADEKEQHIEISCDCQGHVVIGDKNKLDQILINIISNAVKYTNNGGHINLGIEYLPDDYYRFTCADDGIGMSEEFVKHICDDYIRAEDSRVSKTQGTGLGMSVVKGFTDLMGGKLEIKSKLGEGSTFSVEIHFPPASEEERLAILNQSIEDNEERPKYEGEKALLVEDNALNAEIAMELLQSIGISADWAEDGEIAVRVYEESEINEYFAIFMDMQMPVMDGVTATKHIRNSKRDDNDIPILAMTANTFASDRRICREAGMTGYVPKPISIEAIESALQDI